MATAVFFNAHPDDEVLNTGGTMLLAHQAGHRVVLVCATDGSRGENHLTDAEESGKGTDDSAGSDLAAVRHSELLVAAEILGTDRVEMLGYRDSGMAGTDGNDDPAGFWQADVDEAAERLAAILRSEQADLLTCYDPNGNYGHPDHIQVHRVGIRAAALAGVELVFEATIHREEFREAIGEMTRIAAESGLAGPWDEDDEGSEFEQDLEQGRIGTTGSAITHQVDVRPVLAQKRKALRAHASQIPPDSFFLTLPDEVMAMGLGTEWYVQRGVTPTEILGTDLFESLAPSSAPNPG